jgi:hypothetical protein
MGVGIGILSSCKGRGGSPPFLGSAIAPSDAAPWRIESPSSFWKTSGNYALGILEIKELSADVT